MKNFEIVCLQDMLERFLDRPFNYEELRNRVSAYVGESWLDKKQAVELNPYFINFHRHPWRDHVCV